eukprot:1142087-Pelagomonas_calceolata.AAC.5
MSILGGSCPFLAEYLMYGTLTRNWLALQTCPDTTNATSALAGVLVVVVVAAAVVVSYQQRRWCAGAALAP